MKIVKYEDSHFENDEVYFDDVTVKYYQNNDCTEESDMIQELCISSRNNGCGRFIHIKTDGWSIDNPNDLIKIIKDFYKRADIETEEDNPNISCEKK